MDNDRFTQKLSEILGISREQISSLIEGLAAVMAEKGSQMESVVIPGFGVFETKKKNERTALHPSSGKRLLIPPKIIMTFKPGTTFKSLIKNGK